jgi:hypothetical protein
LLGSKTYAGRVGEAQFISRGHTTASASAIN